MLLFFLLFAQRIPWPYYAFPGARKEQLTTLILKKSLERMEQAVNVYEEGIERITRNYCFGALRYFRWLRLQNILCLSWSQKRRPFFYGRVWNEWSKLLTFIRGGWRGLLGISVASPQNIFDGSGFRPYYACPGFRNRAFISEERFGMNGASC